MQHATLLKYLSQHAEPEVKSAETLLSALPHKHLNSCLVIPAYDERADFLSRLLQHAKTGETLIILVINAPETDLSGNSLNTQLYQFVSQEFECIDKKDNLFLGKKHSTYILCVDRFAFHKIPKKHGVGLARKIGGDVAVKAYAMDRTSSPWVFSTDADANLPHTYFSSANTPADIFSAQVFNFEHVNSSEDHEIFSATRQYENALRYYRNRLSYAGSPYAFFTLGSTLAFNVYAYAQVRGFPKRAGGEDFYLLNKLAKVGKVANRDGITVKIDARKSNRVPFGTGPAVEKIIASAGSGEEYHYYHPSIFEELKLFLTLAESLWNFREDFSRAPWPSQQTKETAERLGINTFFQHAKTQCKSEKRFLKSFHDWFDAFQTLKFIHDMQRHYFPAIPLRKCLVLSETKMN